MFAGVRDQQQVGQFTARLADCLTVARTAADALTNDLQLDCGVAFGVPDPGQAPLASLRERCAGWLAGMEELVCWNNYFIRARQARTFGMSSLVDRLEAGALPPDAVGGGFERIYFSQLLREAIRQKPELAQFDGALHNQRVEEFRQLDRERLALAKFRVLLAHCGGLPPNSGIGPAGIVKAETERKRGHRTVRRLMKEAGSVVQAIKPVFMMSPLSVAQFLAPGAVEFDLLVVDEASQVEPVDALGAIARCRQIVVVGDSKQLPPTRFFMRMTTETPAEEESAPQAAQAQDMESILGLCGARGLPQAMLRWHYRSRHHSLIAVSNREFYEDRLFIVPSPQDAVAELGLKFHHLPEGVFDAGGSGSNRIEAKAVCRAVVEHARRTPELTLGVAAFSIRQQQAILDELELLRRENPDLETFFNDHPAEPFFVKNLENVQGDERDVIFISVGYARDVHGFLAMRFGPLSIEGGGRRLNVLISRAKRRCEVFSAITAEDIDLTRASGRGVAALKTFLAFAQTGDLHVAQPSGREEQSPFEAAVRRALESLGYEVHPQVGIAGFFIDLAVVDPQQAGSHLLGIECDGAAYHSSRSARDRDRLRQAVLEEHGWIIHRIWSTDWFQRPGEQLRRMTEAIERARRGRTAAAKSPLSGALPPAQSPPEIEREAVAEVEDHGLNSLAAPYVAAAFAVPNDREPHELTAKALEAILLRIVQTEGPIHEDELVVRVRDLWDLGRAGARIQDAVAKGVRSLLVTGKCRREEEFLSIPGAPLVVRNRENVQSANLRKPDLLPPEEIRAAILALIDTHHGAGGEQIPVAVARIFGFKSTSGPLREVIAAQTDKLRRQGVIEEADGMFKRVG
jgi:very-short-patch-repair endonuclease